MKRETLADKIFVIGVDALDPRLTRKYVDMGKMPNFKKLIEQGSARQDLTLLGAIPTITPPQWTTLATGAYPMTHDITCFLRQSPYDLDKLGYNLDSRNCKAEPIWNCFAEAGKKTLVFHWPGSSWPPTSDSENLMVVDGSSPGTATTSRSQTESEFILIASPNNAVLTYKPKAATDSNIPCVIVDDDEPAAEDSTMEGLNDLANLDYFPSISLNIYEGQYGVSDTPVDFVMSPIKDASGWATAPAGAKEFAILFAKGKIRRPGLILPNADGIYDSVAFYKSKKDTVPMVTIKNREYVRDVLDDSFKKGEKCTASRDMRVLEMAPDGSYVKMWISAAMNIENCGLFSPSSIYEELVANVGYPVATSTVGGGDKTLITDCMLQCWYHAADWEADSINYLIKQYNLDAIFSHFHNVDLQAHMVMRYLKSGHKDLTPQDYEKFIEDIYVQTDYYLSQYMYLLDEGWTLFVVSDHAQVCPEHMPIELGDSVVNVKVMQELGFTTLKKDADGNDLHEIDWEHTKAVSSRCNHIYINLKGRNHTGIVEPEDQYQLEEEIMTALYGYRDKVTNQRVVALAVRRQDAVMLGLGGEYPQCGDIIYAMAEGYNFDHGDSLSTAKGVGDTSVSPIFIAAGKGIKSNFITNRVIRQVDVAPTISMLGGVRVPKECEGAPIYQIFAEEF